MMRRTSSLPRNIIKSSNGNTFCVQLGLEIHCQLNLKHKLFSKSWAIPGKPPNTNVSLFDAGMPGSLPVLNSNALRLAVKAGLALSAKIPERTFFDRKHYFYPDLPHGYQITQHYEPIAKHGKVVLNQLDGFEEPIDIGISQIQLEMDSGKSITGTDLIDLNRAGLAVLEIVSCPDLT
jgi:aspartyl-tRNA(Asn)/glutamyl-tRNA(Gln) amidotransferase subunit B